MHRFFSRLGLAQRLAATCGGLCLLVALALVFIGNLSTRHTILMQEAVYGQYLAQQVATETATAIGNGDLIGLEVTLEKLLLTHQLLGLSVYDVQGRQIGAAGITNSPPSRRFGAAIAIDGNIAGEAHIVLAPAAALREQKATALGLLLLAILMSLFVTAAAARWSQKIALRLQVLSDKLHIDRAVADPGQAQGELEMLEQRIANLPLDLLKSSSGAGIQRASYEAAGLLYIRLNSLVHYVETLDDTALLSYTELQQRLVSAACELYEGELSVVRQFGLLVSFSGGHAWGSPVFRAASTAWMIQQLVGALQPHMRLRLRVSMACGISEAGAASTADIYPGLYCQQAVDELAAMVSTEPEAILLDHSACVDTDITAAIVLGGADTSQTCELLSFREPRLKLLQRQRQILVRQLLPSAQGRDTQQVS